MKINSTQQKGLPSDTSPSLSCKQDQSNLPCESFYSHSENQHGVALPSSDSLPNFGVKVNPLINAEAHDCFREEGKTTSLNTHFDESMKYITSAPMLRAKTKTTCKRRGKCHHLGADAGKLRFWVLVFFSTHTAAAEQQGSNCFLGPAWESQPLEASAGRPDAASTPYSGRQPQGWPTGVRADSCIYGAGLVLPRYQQGPASPHLESAYSSGKSR